MAQQTLAKDAPTFEPETISRLYRLQRALSNADILDEFLVNPKEVGERYGVTLSDEEITAVRNASHFVASWDFFCGEGQWLDAALPNGRAPASSRFISEVVARSVRTRIAQEILRDTPGAIHKVVSTIGSSTLADPEENLEDLPEHILPLARTIRRLARTMGRELSRELAAVRFHGLLNQSTHPPMVRESDRSTTVPYENFGHGNAVEQLSMALGAYMQDVVNRAVVDAVGQVQPGITRPFGRPTQKRRMEQPTA